MASELRLRCWQGYDSAALLQPFEQRHDTRVVAETLISDASAAERITCRDGRCDVLNINNAWVAGCLHPRGLVEPLDSHDLRSPAVLLPHLDSLQRWTRSLDGRQTLGIVQRFGPFNLVVNERAVSRATAEDQGFDLAADPARHARYGILLYEDFNLFHVCIAAGVDPFRSLGETARARFEQTAARWLESAAMISADHATLNAALVERQLDFYLSGGIYTASAARLAGRHEIRAITPARGPIDGRGGIGFAEITCVPRQAGSSKLAQAFLRYLLEPQTALRAAIAARHLQPGRPDGRSGRDARVQRGRARRHTVGYAGGRHGPVRGLQPDAGR